VREINGFALFAMPRNGKDLRTSHWRAGLFRFWAFFFAPVSRYAMADYTLIY